MIKQNHRANSVADERLIAEFLKAHEVQRCPTMAVETEGKIASRRRRPPGAETWAQPKKVRKMPTRMWRTYP